MATEGTLSQFMAITNCDDTQAQLLLESTQFNLESAVALFFQLSEENNNGSHPLLPTSRGGSLPGSFGSGVGGGGLELPTDESATGSSRLQPFNPAARRPHEDSFNDWFADEEPVIREPIRPTRETLIEPPPARRRRAGGGGGGGGGDHRERLQDRDYREPYDLDNRRSQGRSANAGGGRPRTSGGGAGGARNDDLSDFYVDDRPQRSGTYPTSNVFATPAASAGASGNSKADYLAKLFEPPAGLSYRGELKMAREIAVQQRKHIMVNIQDPTEFSSQLLNRDVWKHEQIQALIKEQFLFWQRLKTEEEGKMFVSWYKVTTFPYVAVLDAVTGVVVRTMNNVYDPTAFLLQLLEVVEEAGKAAAAAEAVAYSASPAAALAMREAMAAHEKESAANHNSQREEEELQKAIEMSLKEGKGQGAATRVVRAADEGEEDNDEDNVQTVDSDDDDDEDNEYVEDDGPDVLDGETNNAEDQDQDKSAPIPISIPPEPEAGTDTCTIRFISPTGQRVQRRFRIQDSLASIVAFLKHEGLMEVSSQLMRAGPRVNLLDNPLDSTLAALNISSETIRIENP